MYCHMLPVMYPIFMLDAQELLAGPKGQIEVARHPDAERRKRGLWRSVQIEIMGSWEFRQERLRFHLFN